MTLQQLRYIIEIAQSGSISLAAQRLFITQPSLSKSVADLEKEMGITIFYRGSRGVMLSPDGSVPDIIMFSEDTTSPSSSAGSIPATGDGTMLTASPTAPFPAA